VRKLTQIAVHDEEARKIYDMFKLTQIAVNDEEARNRLLGQYSGRLGRVIFFSKKKI
jgi:hypothetical protein